MSTHDGWTRVHRKSRHPRRTTPHHPPLPDTFAPRTTGLLRPPSALRADHDRLRAEWLASPACASLLLLLRAPHAAAAAAAAPPHIAVRTAVCLGIGTFDPPGGAWEAKRAAYVQLCAFSTIVSHLESYTQHPIECVFQDPVFTPSDVAFLADLGYRVVPSPAAYALVDRTTLLFAIHLYRPIYAAAFQQPDLPAIFVGTGWDVWDTVTIDGATDLENMRRMDRTYTRHAFPQDAASTAFSSTSIYFAPPGATSAAVEEAVEETTSNKNRTGEDTINQETSSKQEPKDKDTTDKDTTDNDLTDKEEPKGKDVKGKDITDKDTIDKDTTDKDTTDKEEPKGKDVKGKDITDKDTIDKDTIDKDTIGKDTGGEQRVEKRLIGRV